MELLLEQLLPIKLENQNQHQSRDWRAAVNRRKKYERLLRYKKLVRKPFRFPVQVIVTRILGPREQKWDHSSIGRGNYKEIEDSLVSLGWFNDDSPKWIVETRFKQDDSQRKNGPKVLIQVYST